MPTQEKQHAYTVEQYSKLNEEQKAALALVAEDLSADMYLEEPITDEHLSHAFGILAPTDGCVPGGYVSDDILLRIRAKFACIFHAACEVIERRWRQAGRENKLLVVVIDPSYEDATHVAVCDYKSPGRCYFQGYYKAWSYTFDSLSEIADEVLTLVGRIDAAEWERT
jgi:hypothetical protein